MTRRLATTMETKPFRSADEARAVHLRCLLLETAAPFRANGDQLRRCITAILPDDPDLHHHLAGKGRLSAPPVRYVVTGGLPRLLGVNEGLEALDKLYELPKLTLRDREGYKVVEERELWDVHARIGVSSRRRVYRSLTPWLALNQQNHRAYQRARDTQERNGLLEQIFVGNVLAMLKGFDFHVASRLEARLLRCRERPVQHKHTDMMGFLVTVETNALLHPWLGIGKLVSKGFGLFHHDDPRRFQAGRRGGWEPL